MRNDFQKDQLTTGNNVVKIQNVKSELKNGGLIQGSAIGISGTGTPKDDAHFRRDVLSAETITAGELIILSSLLGKNERAMFTVTFVTRVVITLVIKAIASARRGLKTIKKGQTKNS